MDKCFCHFNGYKVKDADARAMLDGRMAMGDIRVSGIKCKNEFNVEKWVKSGNNSNYYSYSNGVLSINKLDDRGLNKFTESEKIYLDNGTYTISCGDAQVRIYNNGTDYPINHSGAFEVTLGYIYIKFVSSEIITCQPMIEKGNVATEYAPYFEIGSGSKGFYQLELPIGMITPGENFMGDNPLPTECNDKLQELLNTIRIDNCKSPIVVIKNTIEKSTYQGVEIDNPIQLTLTNMRVTEPSGENAGRFDFYGISDYLDSIYVSEDGQEHIRYDAMLSVPFKLNGGSVDLTDCVGNVGLRQYTLVTKEYIDGNVIFRPDDTLGRETTSTANIVDLVTETTFTDNVELADIKDVVESAMDKFLKGETSVPSFILKHNSNKSAVNSVLLTFSTNSNNNYKFKGYGMYITGNGSLSIKEIVLTANMSTSVNSSTGNYKLNSTPSIVVTSKSIS